MDNDKYGTLGKDKDAGSDSDSSFVIVTDDNSAGGSDSENSENYVIVGHENCVASDSGENLFGEIKDQSKNVNNVVTDCEYDLSDERKNQLEKKADKACCVGTDSEDVLSDEIKQKLKIVVNGSDTDTDTENDLSDECMRQPLKKFDNDSSVGADSEGDLFGENNLDLGNVGSDSYMSTDSVEYLSDESKQQLNYESHAATDSEENPFDGFREQLKISDNDNHVDTRLSVMQSKKRHNVTYKFDGYPWKRIGVFNDGFLEGKMQNKKMDFNDDTVEYLSDECKQRLNILDYESYAATDSEENPFDGFGEQLKFFGNNNHACTRLSVARSKKRHHVPYTFDRYPWKRIGVIRVGNGFPGGTIEHKKMDLNDVTMEYVLPFLPAKSLCKLRAVSKEWDRWIGSAFFIHKQAHYFKDISGLFCQFPRDDPFFISLDNEAYGIPEPALTFLPESVSLITTCNGLLCCQSCHDEDSYYICNPVNKQWKKLPMSEYYHGPNCFMALAFEPSVLDFSEHFELVCAFSVTGHAGVYFDIFSSSSSTWKLSETVCYELEASDLNVNGHFYKGVVFWETSIRSLLAFDLKEKQYGLLPLPLSTEGAQGLITEVNGEMCYILPREEDGQYALDFYGNMDMSLKRKIYLVGDDMFDNVTEELRVLACVKDEVVVLLLGDRLIAYHLRTGEVEMLRYVNGWGRMMFLPYVNSLVEMAM